MTDTVRLSLCWVLQQLIEAELTATIGAAPGQRSESRTAQRNGHRPKLLTTAAGDVEVGIPKLRTGSFFPSILERRRRIDRALFAVVMEAYVHGVSTRSVDDLVKALGAASGISKSEVSRICAELDGDLEAFRTRPLEGEFPYVFADATYVKARVRGRVISRAAVVATGVRADGGREVLGLAVGDSEDGVFWAEFFRSLRHRGLPGSSWSSPTITSGCRRPSARSSSARRGRDAGSTSCETCWPGCPRRRPRWSRRLFAPSSPNPTPPMSAPSSMRSPACSPPSSPTSPPCSPTPERTCLPSLLSPSPTGRRSGARTPSSGSTGRSSAAPGWSGSFPTTPPCYV